MDIKRFVTNNHILSLLANTYITHISSTNNKHKIILYIFYPINMVIKELRQNIWTQWYNSKINRWTSFQWFSNTFKQAKRSIWHFKNIKFISFNGIGLWWRTFGVKYQMIRAVKGRFCGVLLSEVPLCHHLQHISPADLYAMVLLSGFS